NNRRSESGVRYCWSLVVSSVCGDGSRCRWHAAGGRWPSCARGWSLSRGDDRAGSGGLPAPLLTIRCSTWPIPPWGILWRWAPKAASRVGMASFGALTMLVLQFVLGTAYSLYGTAPTSGKPVGMFSSPLLVVHVILGILLIIAAIMLVVRAIQARRTPLVAS